MWKTKKIVVEYPFVCKIHFLSERGFYMNLNNNMEINNSRVQAEMVESSSQTERAVIALREMLIRGHFRPGERLAELSLAPLLNVSRTPVRLALEKLAHQGLLEPMPTGGFRVREFSALDIWDAIETRGVLEGVAARFAAERLESMEELEGLRRSCSVLQQIIPLNMDLFVRYIEENLAFHHELWRLSKSPMLIGALESVCALPFAEPGALVFGGVEDVEGTMMGYGVVALDQHRSIVEAIEERESSRAECLAREHARLARRNLKRALQNRELRERIPCASLISSDDLDV